jgi:hypothetical protein
MALPQVGQHFRVHDSGFLYRQVIERAEKRHGRLRGCRGTVHFVTPGSVSVWIRSERYADVCVRMPWNVYADICEALPLPRATFYPDPYRHYSETWNAWGLVNGQAAERGTVLPAPRSGGEKRVVRIGRHVVPIAPPRQPESRGGHLPQPADEARILQRLPELGQVRSRR